MARQQTTINVDGQDYLVTKFPADFGWDLQSKLAEFAGLGKMPDAATMKEVICKGVAIGSVEFSAAKFNDHFSGKYTHLMKLFEEVLKYNFDENFTESDTNEK